MKASLEEMPAAFVDVIEPAGVRPVELLHAPRQVRLRRLDDEVEVVGHQHVRRDGPAEAGRGLAEETQKGPSIAVRAKDRTSLIAAGGDVIQRVLEFDAKCSCHDATEDPSAAHQQRKCLPIVESGGSKQLGGETQACIWLPQVDSPAGFAEERCDPMNI